MVTVSSFDRGNWTSESESDHQSAAMGNYSFDDSRPMADQAQKNMVSITSIKLGSEPILTRYRPSTSP